MSSTVCVFLPSFKGGGAERVAVLLANSIVENGWNVQVVVQEKGGPWREVLDPRADVLVLGGRARGLPFKMRYYLHQNQPEAVISFMTGFNIVAIIADVLSNWRGRLIVTEHCSLEGTWTECTYLQSWALWGAMRLLYRRADLVVAVSRQLANDLVIKLNLPEGKVVAIPNPIPIDEIRRVAKTPVSHRYFKEGVPVLVAVGRLHSQKDFPMLLKAIANLRQRRDVRLIVLGEGPDRSELEAMVVSLGLSEVVDLPGFVSPPWPWMARANVLVMSSRYEGWPVVLAEGMTLGVPIVATDCPTGPREILGGGKWGRLVPIGDVDAMSGAIETLLDNPPDPTILQNRANEWSTERVLHAYLSTLSA